MTSDNTELRKALGQAQRAADGAIPEFESVFAAAEARRNHRPAVFAAGTAAAVVLVAVMLIQATPPANEPPLLIDVEELVASTSWVAPSDSLLPEHRFDIFQELPVMFESTGREEGTLL